MTQKNLTSSVELPGNKLQNEFERLKRGELIILYKICPEEEQNDNAHEFHTCVGKIRLNNIKVNILWD
jgi:hypothetical protein